MVFLSILCRKFAISLFFAEKRSIVLRVSIAMVRWTTVNRDNGDNRERRKRNEKNSYWRRRWWWARSAPPGPRQARNPSPARAPIWTWSCAALARSCWRRHAPRPCRRSATFSSGRTCGPCAVATVHGRFHPGAAPVSRTFRARPCRQCRCSSRTGSTRSATWRSAAASPAFWRCCSPPRGTAKKPVWRAGQQSGRGRPRAGTQRSKT